MLEPYEGKLSRTVLRGEGGSNTADLPDSLVENMQRFISQVMTSKSVSRTCEDIDEAKTEIIADEQAFYKNEQAYMSDLCNKVLDGSVDRESFYSEINDYLNKYYENRYELRNQPDVVETKINHLIAKLQKMYGNIM